MKQSSASNSSDWSCFFSQHVRYTGLLFNMDHKTQYSASKHPLCDILDNPGHVNVLNITSTTLTLFPLQSPMAAKLPKRPLPRDSDSEWEYEYSTTDTEVRFALSNSPIPLTRFLQPLNPLSQSPYIPTLIPYILAHAQSPKSDILRNSRPLLPGTHQQPRRQASKTLNAIPNNTSEKRSEPNPSRNPNRRRSRTF